MELRAMLLEVRAKLQVVDALRDDLAHLHRRLLLTEDRKLAKVLVPLLAALLPESAELTAEDMGNAVLNDRTPNGAAAKELMAKHEVGWDPGGGWRQLGNFLERIEGAACGGYRVVRARKIHNSWARRIEGVKKGE
jgi:hypothetical protein